MPNRVECKGSWKWKQITDKKKYRFTELLLKHWVDLRTDVSRWRKICVTTGKIIATSADVTFKLHKVAG